MPLCASFAPRPSRRRSPVPARFPPLPTAPPSDDRPTALPPSTSPPTAGTSPRSLRSSSWARASRRARAAGSRRSTAPPPPGAPTWWRSCSGAGRRRRHGRTTARRRCTWRRPTGGTRRWARSRGGARGWRGRGGSGTSRRSTAPRSGATRAPCARCSPPGPTSTAATRCLRALLLCSSLSPAQAGPCSDARLLNASSPNPRVSQNARTPLLHAAAHGRVEASRALLEAGADVHLGSTVRPQAGRMRRRRRRRTWALLG